MKNYEIRMLRKEEDVLGDFLYEAIFQKNDGKKQLYNCQNFSLMIFILTYTDFPIQHSQVCFVRHFALTFFSNILNIILLIVNISLLSLFVSVE